MTRVDPQIQEHVDRLFDRFERMTDAEFMLLRTVWEEQDPGLRQDAWASVKATVKQRGRESQLNDARNRIASWVNNYAAPLAMGDVPMNFAGSGMDPGSIRRAAIPPMLDAVAATIAAGERGVPGHAYNVGGGSRVTINHVLDVVARLAGHPLEIRREASQKGDMRDTYADTSRARAELGFEPRVSLEDGLEAEYRWLSTTPALAR